MRRLISTALCPPSASSLTRSVRSLIGHSSGPLPDWTRKQTRVWRSITTRLLPCVNVSAECRSKLKQVKRNGQKFKLCYFIFYSFIVRYCDKYEFGLRENLAIVVINLFILSSELPDPTLIIDPITEERASRTLYRIELLRRIREQVLPHPLLSERLKLCQPSPDLPEWWECGHHDRDLLLGASKHGVSRTDYHILNDPTLAFLEAHQRFTSQRGANISMGAQGETGRTAESISAPILTPAELVSVAAATKIAVNTAKVEEEKGKDVKTEEGKTEMELKMEKDKGDASDIPCTETEIPDEQKENKGEVGEGKDDAIASPRKDIKKEEDVAQLEEELKEELSGEKTPKPTDDKDLTEEEKSVSDALGDQKEIATELSGPSASPKAQASQKTVEEEDREERESPESPKSPKSADTEKSPDEEEEERMDEDDKSEKSSQAEGSGNFIAFTIAWK